MTYDKEQIETAVNEVIPSVFEVEDYYLQLPQADDVPAVESLFTYSPEELADEIKSDLEKIGIVLLPPDILGFEKLDMISRKFLPAKVRFKRDAIETIKTAKIQDGEFLCTIIEKATGATFCIEISQNGFLYETLPDYLFEKIE